MKRSAKMNSAYAYFRLAAKSRRAGNWGEVEHYSAVAYRLVEQDRRDREARERTFARIREANKPKGAT
jgi:hypothetical protein